MNLSKIRGGAGDITKPDLNARIQDNLYLAVNSDWISKAKIPADRPLISSFSEIDLKIEKELMNDLADFASGKKALPDIPNFDKAIEVYKLAKDFAKRDADDFQPAQADLETLINLKDVDDVKQNLAKLLLRFSFPFLFEVEPDRKNTKTNSLSFDRNSLILPDTTSYQSPSAKQLLDVWQKQTENLLKMAGVEEAAAKKYATDAIALDAKIVKVAKSAEERADDVALYNPIKTNEFEEKTSSLNLGQLLEQLFEKRPNYVVVREPKFLDHFNELFNQESFDELKGWLISTFINKAAAFLSEEFRQAAFPFKQATYGQKELPSQEKEAYYKANNLFDDVIGVYYGRTYFGEDAKADVEDMIHRMIDVYEQRITNNEWLSPATKEKAITKLRALVLKIGYPNKIDHVYDLFQVTPANEGGNLYSNQANIREVSLKHNFDKLYKPVDRSEWYMPGNLINACYDPQRNDITFPAAILEAPFYDINASRATNYGGIGVVIAHEISHAFDNNGAKYDEFGNMKNWWTKEDFAEFEKRTQAEIDLFDGIKYGPVTLNGKQIVSENIADQGGLTAGIEANKNEHGDMKELFENYARIWASKESPEIIKTIAAFDVHAPGPERVNVQVQCQPEFYKAFNIQEGDGMWLDPAKRVVIW
ncbi:M13 family metallopeptidase [Lactobacillus helveticus]|uniref:M13 family metallopeptidase n=1 Tax=Lactobacillus helveticus TaxID=1587 RepID=UPI001C64E824|nr:M13 family metallopeptidase [Lactobacillus helveticus]MBW7988270.1 M13 family peptidase [Lactobacillus helveticus]